MPAPRAMALPDAEIVAALKRGDEAVFIDLVDAYTPGLMRMAQTVVGDPAAADEIVQEAWFAALRGIDGFDGRSSLKAWVFRVLLNTAKARDSHSIAFSAAVGETEPAVDPDRFLGPNHRFPGGWMMAPSEWHGPDDEFVRGEIRASILRAIDQLSEAQRAVITMRDVEGFPAEEVSAALGISDGTQRVLLHRARSRVRGAIETQLGAVEPNTFALEHS